MLLLRRIITLKKCQALSVQNYSSKKVFSFDINSGIINLSVCGQNEKFPSVWLRDNCQCENCFHKSAQSRIIDWSNLNVNIVPREISEVKDGIKVTWDDGHVSEFQENWLNVRSFSKNQQKKYSESVYRPKKITWKGGNLENILTKHDYHSVLKSDEKLHDWLLNLSIYGVALIQGVPNEDTAVDNIVDRVAFLKRTHYGKRFTVQHVTGTSNVAYLSSNLQMHTDLPYYEYCPGVNILHCLQQTQSKGGMNLLADCHYVANYIKEKHPKEYKLLSKTIIEWSDIGTEHGKEFYKLYRAPVICEDDCGEIFRINFSIPQRGSHFPIDLNDVKPWYSAHNLFLQLCLKFAAKFKTKQGEMLVFDNIRMLHGRTQYEDTSDNVRKLIGVYMDWDEIFSKLRCLKVRLNK